MIFANLLHLSYNMWADWQNPAVTSPYWAARPYLRFDDTLWSDLLTAMKKGGLNMVVIDVGDGVRFESHPEIAVDATQLARVLLERGDPLAAEPLLREALAIRIAHDGETHGRVADALALLATAMEEQGDGAEAERLLRQALDVSRASRGDDDVGTASIAERLTTLGATGLAPAGSASP